MTVFPQLPFFTYCAKIILEKKLFIKKIYLYLAAVLKNVISEPLVSSGQNFGVVPSHQLDSLSVCFLFCVKVGDGVLAVIGDVLVCRGAEQLQESDLIAVGLVGHLKTKLIL